MQFSTTISREPVSHQTHIRTNSPQIVPAGGSGKNLPSQLRERMNEAWVTGTDWSKDSKRALKKLDQSQEKFKKNIRHSDTRQALEIMVMDLDSHLQDLPKNRHGNFYYPGQSRERDFDFRHFFH